MGTPHDGPNRFFPGDETLGNGTRWDDLHNRPPPRVDAPSEQYSDPSRFITRGSVTACTVILTLLILVYFQPAFVMIRPATPKGKARFSYGRLAIWVALCVIIVGYHEKVRYLYSTLVCPVQSTLYNAFNIGQFFANAG